MGDVLSRDVCVSIGKADEWIKVFVNDHEER